MAMHHFVAGIKADAQSDFLDRARTDFAERNFDGAGMTLLDQLEVDATQAASVRSEARAMLEAAGRYFSSTTHPACHEEIAAQLRKVDALP
jgi:hypothetical protein